MKPAPAVAFAVALALWALDSVAAPKEINGCGLRPGTVCMEARLAGAQLPGTNLERGGFFRADFPEANLERASLRGADLRGASFEEATLEGADLTGARIDASTRLVRTRTAGCVGCPPGPREGP